MYDAFEDRMQADFPTKIDLVLNTFKPDKPGRLLDVGCGKGYFVRACVDRGLNAWGIDLSVTGIEFARKKLHLKAHQGSLADLKNELGLFDAVTFWATIEHLPDPIRMLRDISDILKPSGRLFLDTGLGDDWLDRLLPGRVQWYDPPQHLYVFSRGGLQAALAKAGFRIERLEPNFERSSLRRFLKTLRNAAVATGLRTDERTWPRRKKRADVRPLPPGQSRLYHRGQARCGLRQRPRSTQSFSPSMRRFTSPAV